MLVKVLALGLKRMTVPRSVVSPIVAIGAAGSPKWYSCL